VGKKQSLPWAEIEIKKETEEKEMNKVVITESMRNVMVNLLRGDSVRVTVSDSGYPQSVIINGLPRAIVGSTVQGLIARGYVELGEAVEGVCDLE
jgi:translation initiation factor IF-1